MGYWRGRPRWGSIWISLTSGLVFAFFRSEILGDSVAHPSGVRVFAPTAITHSANQPQA
jgi:hypothetical protein